MSAAGSAFPLHPHLLAAPAAAGAPRLLLRQQALLFLAFVHQGLLVESGAQDQPGDRRDDQRDPGGPAEDERQGDQRDDVDASDEGDIMPGGMAPIPTETMGPP